MSVLLQLMKFAGIQKLSVVNSDQSLTTHSVVSSRETSAARERGEEAKQNSHGEIENIEQRRETHCR